MTARTIDDDVLAVLGNCYVDGNILFLPDGQLDRKLYVAVNAVLATIGGTWNRKAKGHVFNDDPTDALESLLLTGEYVKPEDYGFFPTPPDLAASVVGLAQIDPGMDVLEPSAGTGALAVPARDAGAIVECIELLDSNVKVLRGHGFICDHGDFLRAAAAPTYDRVVMNPPFARQQDIWHVMHAWDFLRPGGRLVSVMSAGVTFRNDHRATQFREFVDQHSGTITPNPDGSFRPSGTDVRTVTVVMNKERDS